MEGSDLVPTPNNLKSKDMHLFGKKQAEWGPAYFTTTLHRIPSANTRRTYTPGRMQYLVYRPFCTNIAEE